ncbi:MAG: hypothetical protein R2699_03145 [Acidimicrobiales bacterium]
MEAVLDHPPVDDDAPTLGPPASVKAAMMTSACATSSSTEQMLAGSYEEPARTALCGEAVPFLMSL